MPHVTLGELPQVEAAPELRGTLLCLRPHAAASEQVWHPAGYAGDERFLCPWRRRHPGALRLWRNTGEDVPASMLEAYAPSGTPAICEAQAEHWLDQVSARGGAESPAQCVAFDSGLFGSRWFEGHAWLARALRHAASDARFSLHFASHALTMGAIGVLDSPAAEPGPGGAETSGDEGATVWRNRRSEALWAEVHECEGSLQDWAQKCAGTSNPKLREVLNQCARELLLIESCDWPLLLASSPPAPEREDDARARLAEHLEAFRCLLSIAATIARGEFMTEGQRAFLDALCERDDLFADASFAAWGEA